MTGGKPLSAADIGYLLKEDANRPRGGGRGPRVDNTEERTIQNWYKLFHHFCTPDCEHREQAPEGSQATQRNQRACWNVNCLDETRSIDDRGTNIVVEVKGQWICRYCFLGNYLK